MNITDELREFVRGADGYELWCPRHRAELLEIADRIDTALIANGYVELPKDRDGKYIRVGDRMQVCDTGTVFNVTLLRLINSGWVVNPVNFVPSNLRHYREPTVEDVLREFVTEFNRDDSELCDGEIIERFAAKLQLKEHE